MNKKKSIVWVCILFLVVWMGVTTVSFAVVTPNAEFYVKDDANVLSEETEDYIMQTNIDLEQKTGAQIVVVTIPSLEGESIEEYANELFRAWGIGSKEKNNGLLLLCSTGDRLFRVEVGYGLEGILPDGKTGRMQDEYIIPYLKENNYDEGIRNGYSAFLQEIAEEYGVTISNGQTAKVVSSTSNNVDYSIIAMFISIFVTGISLSTCLLKKSKKSFLTYIIIEIVQGIILWFLFRNIFFIIVGFILGNIFALNFRYGGFIGGGRFGGGSFGGFSGGGFSGGGGSSRGGGSTRGF